MVPGDSLPGSINDKLLNYGGITLPDPAYPDEFLSDLIENGELFVPSRLTSPTGRLPSFGSRVSYAAIINEESLTEAIPCAVEFVPGYRGECYANNLELHTKTGHDLVIGYGLVNGYWMPHAFCFDVENSILYEATWRFPGVLYYGIRGYFEPVVGDFGVL